MSAKIIRPARATCVRFFTARRICCRSVSVCPTVRLSVCPSRASIVSKWNRESYVAYRLATIPMILNDVEGHSPIASFLKMVFFVQLFSHDMISTDSVVARSLDDSWASASCDSFCWCGFYFSILLVLTRDCYRRLTIVKLKIMMDLFSVFCGVFYCLSRL